ncbi:MAG: FAD-binding oxidoreductase [bacterium]|nr:FAD-binding oxidoreductase [bacterium]
MLYRIMQIQNSGSTKNYDAVVIGGGIIGMATAYNLCKKGIKTAVIERKYVGSGSTGRCIGGIRHQFSTPTSIRLMIESIKLFSQMKEEFGFEVEFHQGGYLLLAHSPELVEVFKSNIAIQQKQGVDVSLLTPEEAKKVVPDLDINGLLAAAFCPDDAQAFPFPVLKGYKKKIDETGGTFFLHNPVVNFQKKKNFLLTLQDGTMLEAGKVLLSAGPWAKELGNLMGLDLPLFPERHEAMITERIPRFFEPMVVDYRKDGCYFHQLISGQIIGCYSPTPNVPGIHEDTSFEFLPRLAKRMIRLIPNLEKASVLRHWSGCYTMTPDGNPILDESPVENLYLGVGMSGHGFMFAPAMGRHLADFMLSGEWEMNFHEFSINRSYDGKETLK